MNEFYEEIDEVLHSSDVAKGDARCSPCSIVKSKLSHALCSLQHPDFSPVGNCVWLVVCICSVCVCVCVCVHACNVCTVLGMCLYVRTYMYMCTYVLCVYMFVSMGGWKHVSHLILCAAASHMSQVVHFLFLVKV